MAGSSLFCFIVGAVLREAPARPYKNSMKPRRNILYASSSMPSDA
jgi:hypothetical protein